MPSQNAAVSIALQSFFDFELDLYGWYAFGHHDLSEFLDAVLMHDSKARFLPQNIQHGWAAFHSDGFDFVTRSIPGFQPITAIAWSGIALVEL